MTLTISLTHNEEPNPEILWLLEDVKVQEPKWYQGRVEVRPRDEESATFIVRNLAFLLFYLLFNISKEMKKSVKNIKDKNEIQGDPKQTDIFEMATTLLWVLLLKYVFKYCFCLIKGFSLIFLPKLTHKSEVAISKISVCFDSPCSITV